MTDLPKTFDPADIERRWYAHWETNGLFHPARPGAEPWTIVNPPPNVTGSLHIGHALDNTLQDILTRHARLQGKDALWVVGTDHAGIATQMVVERQMAERQDKRTNYTREQFIEKVWEWKAESGGEITRQLRRLGCSMDWANERFTMDDGFSRAVRKVFVDLYNQGLIYRDKRLVNWDPGLGTAISDLEVETREVQGHFWRLRYPLADRSGFIEVATTRPETMLADMAVAVHPDDARYTHLIGKEVILPITGRHIPTVADEHADPALGSGAVKITPGHDFNDFEVGIRAGFVPSLAERYAGADPSKVMLNMLDREARIVQVFDALIPQEFIGLTTAEARKMVVARLKADGVLIPYIDKDGVEHDAEPRTIQTPFGDRSGVVIEPWLTDQWYVDAEAMAKRPIEAVRSGAIEIVPKTWEKTFFNWMENIQPWCVSRQLWWGHRIPAWYGPRDTPFGYDWVNLCHFVAESEAEAIKIATAYYPGKVVRLFESQIEVDVHLKSYRTEVPIFRDPDVLDTWFSSALWPFATLGWPDSSPSPRSRGEGDIAADGSLEAGVPLSPTLSPEGERETLNGRYPNDILISGFDILFFWDARMMMMGTHFMGDVPFRKLYLHGLVRAADGQKMSKSKGNTVDPLGLIDTYGADALRFFMAAMESQGRDIKMDERRVEGYRNFATKLWNACRFAQANGIAASTTLEPPAARLAVNHWIIAETVACVRAVDRALADLRFDGAANAVYQFVWSRFCDWYLELIKPILSSNPSPEGEGFDDAAETRAVAGWVIDQILVVLHPFMPFITEELWHAMGPRDYDLIVARWPVVDDSAVNADACREIDWVIEVIEQIRSQRLETGFKATDRIPLGIANAPQSRLDILNKHAAVIARIARIQPAVIEINPHDVNSGWNVRVQENFEVREIDRTSFVSVQFPVGDVNFLAFTQGFIDLAAERARLTKAIEAAVKERDALAARLANPSFVERAKLEAVEKARADHAEKSAEADRLGAALARLG